MASHNFSPEWACNGGFGRGNKGINKPASSPPRKGSQPQARMSIKNSNNDFNTYAVNLLLKPVELGIKGKNHSYEQEFKGFGAFNHYFALLKTPSSTGYSVPDIWDGYFHISLANFSTKLEPDRLEKVFNDFNPSLTELPSIGELVFRGSRLTKYSGKNRRSGRGGINFIVISLDPDPIKSFHARIQTLIELIKKQARAERFRITELDTLHVTIRKYSNTGIDLNQIKIAEFPLEFRCSHLEVKQTRDQAKRRFKERGEYRWWTGVTLIEGKCTGCGKSIADNEWEGYCLACGKYESIIPIWSTDGQSINHFQNIQREENEKNPYQIAMN